MKAALYKIIFGNAPRIKVAITSLIIGGATWLVQRFGMNNGPEWSAAMATIGTTLAGWIMDGITAKLATDGVKEIQANLPAAVPPDVAGHQGRFLPEAVAIDGRPGAVTIAAVKDLVIAAEGPTNGVYTPPGH